MSHTPAPLPESGSASQQRAPSPRPSSPGPRPTTPRLQATVRLGSPVSSHGFPASVVGARPASPAPLAQNPLSQYNFPGGSCSTPRFGTPPRLGTPTRFGTPPRLGTPPPQHYGVNIPSFANPSQSPSRAQSIYGSFDSRQPIEDHEVVRRHLVTDDISNPPLGQLGGGGLDTEFSSLQLQGGDITRPIYRYVESVENNGGRRSRSRSFHVPRPEPDDDTLNISNIKQIGGFRRNYIRRVEGASPAPGYAHAHAHAMPIRRQFPTRNFIEFLTLYGHFAGEDLEEEDEGWTSDEPSLEGEGRDPTEGRFDEESELLERPKTVRRKSISHQGTAGSGKAALLLLKSFVGTGVLFLPKAYSNGGMVFCNVVLLLVALLSYYCFVLLVRTRLKIAGSFGDIGGILYGPKMRLTILSSIIVSQIGFAAAYIVFTGENLQAFIIAVTNGETHIDIKWLILLQLVVFLPMSMIRDMAKLGFTALVADFFIMLGLVYLYYYDFFTLATEGISDIVSFNHDNWTLFIGTAIFTFEGIGLIIPIQETMKRPEKFPRVLGGIMVIITIIFLSMGALSYAAYGSNTKTVIILNLPQDDKFVNGVQFLYSLAILLSTPLQLFPAIRIIETGLFPRSGKNNPSVKWQKNAFRFVTVFVTALISWGGADDLDKFVALIGSFACIPLVFIYPPLLHRRAYDTSTFMKVADIALIVFGFLVMGYTTSLTVKKWSDPNQ